MANRFTGWLHEKFSSPVAAPGFGQGAFLFPMNEERSKKYFVLTTGNTLNSHEHFIGRLKQQACLQEVFAVGQCDFILVFCPVVSRAGTDIESGLKKLNHVSDTKPAVLLVLHHTFDPEHVVPESSRAVNRTNTIAVDCLFHEDKGLLQCPRNNQSLLTALSYINSHSNVWTEKQQETKTNKELLEENRQLKDMISLLKEQLAEKIKGEDQGQETACRDMEMMNDTPQGQAVDPETVERTTNKAEKSDNAQHKKDQQSEDEHQRLDHFIVEKMEKSHEEMKKKMDMEKENVKRYVETSTNIISDKIAKLENREKLLIEKETQLKKMNEDLETSKTQRKALKQELQDKNRQLDEHTNTIQMKDAELEKNKATLKQIQRELDETRKELEESKKHNEVKNTELQNIKKLMTEKETQLKKMNDDLETSKTEQETLGQELQDKNSQLQEINLEQQKTESAEKNKQLEDKERLLTETDTQPFQKKNEKGTQIKPEKEKDEEGAGTDLKKKLQNSKEQKVEKIEEPVKNTNAVGENNGNLTQETHAQDKETNKNVDEAYKKFSEKNEHQEDQDTQEKKKDAVRNESSGANERCNNSGENKQQVKKQDPDVSESQRQQEEKHRPQLENTQNMSKVQDESGKATMEVQKEDKKENQCEQESDSRKATIASQEQDKGEKWSKPSGHDPDSSSSEID